MKTLFFTAIILMNISNISAREVRCIVSNIDAPYSDIYLTRVKANKYRMIVSNEGTALLDETVSFTFSRRTQVSTFRNKNSEIKTLALVTNKAVRSQYKIPEISRMTYNGLCKLYKD